MALDAAKSNHANFSSRRRDGSHPPSPLPMIVRVFGDGSNTDVPVTPETTCSDLIECCRDPGEEYCDLVAICPQKGECALRESDHPLEILKRWGSGRLFLRYTVLSSDGGTYEKRNGMKEPEHFGGETLPEGVQLTLSELREMACRQQAQIDSQHQLLAAKEQRLRYLKDQEARQQRVQAETERLRRLRDRVDAQELKLRKLRALRGQVDHHKQNNISLTSDLESIRALFNEKEKELSLAVAKVEELTRQLEELRRGRNRADQVPPASALELDKLRRELMYRNKLNEQQNQKLNQQREALTARQEEMSSIDKRISELQERLHRKRMLNQQLATQISAASNKAAYHQLVRLTGGSTDQTNNHHHHQQFYGARKLSHPNSVTNGGVPQQPQPQQQAPPINGISRGNIATVEPYNHVPLPNGHHIGQHIIGGNQENTTYHPVYQQQQNNQQHIIGSNKNNGELDHEDINKMSGHHQYQHRSDENEALKEFSVSKSDPKYQTLPYNTKFTVNLLSNRVNNRLTENDNNVHSNNSEAKDSNNGEQPLHHISPPANSYHMTAHSAPLNVSAKSMLATPLGQNDAINKKNNDQQTTTNNNNNNKDQLNGNLVGNSAEIVVSSLGNQQYQKPISSVAPTSVHHSGKLSNIYQTSSIKVQPVEPQTVTVSKHLPVLLANTPTVTQAMQEMALSPPQANSTPVGTPELAADKSRPALPPKPAIKPPPRQTPSCDTSFQDHHHHHPPPIPSTEPPPEDSKLSSSSSHRTAPQPPLKTKLQSSLSNQLGGSEPVIKAKPLTIKKQPLGEQPKLRNVGKLNGLNSSSLSSIGSSNRRVEIPSAFNSHHFISSSESASSSSAIASAVVPPPPEKSSLESDKDKDEVDRVPALTSSSVTSDDAVQAANLRLIQQNSSNGEELKSAESGCGVTPINSGGAVVLRRGKKGNLKQTGKANLSRRVSFDPLALLLDASLEGELELVKKTATQVPNPSAANDEGITALHNAICAGHFEIVKFLVEFGCDVNAQDSDGWTPLHCAASCNNVAMVKFLVEHGACIFATTLSDHETAAEKCEEDEEGFDGCSEYLYSVQEKLGILSAGAVFAVFDYQAQQPDELSFQAGQQLTVLRKGDENEREWWWSRLDDKEGYVPRNLLGLYSRVSPKED